MAIPDLASSWRRLLAQQAATTGGQAITPQQAAALQQGVIEGNYANAADRERLGLSKMAQDAQQKYRTDMFGVEKGRLDLGAQQLALQQRQWADKLAMDQARLAEQAREFGTVAPGGLSGTGNIWLQQQKQNLAANNYNQAYNLQRDKLGAANNAAMVSGAIQLPTAGLLGYKVYKDSGLSDFLSNLFGW